MALANHLSALTKPERGLATKAGEYSNVAASVERLPDYQYSDTKTENNGYLGNQYPILNSRGWLLFGNMRLLVVTNLFGPIPKPF